MFECWFSWVGSSDSVMFYTCWTDCFQQLHISWDTFLEVHLWSYRSAPWINTQASWGPECNLVFSDPVQIEDGWKLKGIACFLICSLLLIDTRKSFCCRQCFYLWWFRFEKPGRLEGEGGWNFCGRTVRSKAEGFGGEAAAERKRWAAESEEMRKPLWKAEGALTD